MFEAIALKLITTLTGYMFEGYLDTFKYAKIDGAPSWYQESSPRDELYGYGYSKGGIESIDIAKGACRVDLQNKIQKGIDVIIYDSFSHIEDNAEKEVIKRFQNDANLALFVEKVTKFERIEHQDKKENSIFSDAREARTFAGCMIQKQAIIDYQKVRLSRIKKEVTLHKRDRALEGLDKEFE